MTHFRHKAFAALLASMTGAFGINRLYLGQGWWWLPLGVTVLSLPLTVGVTNWYQTLPFFVLMLPVVAGFIQALVIALMPDDRFDARFNAGQARRNHSGWGAVLVAIAPLLGVAIVLVTSIALLTQRYCEHAVNAAK